MCLQSGMMWDVAPPVLLETIKPIMPGFSLPKAQTRRLGSIVLAMMLLSCADDPAPPATAGAEQGKASQAPGLKSEVTQPAMAPKAAVADRQAQNRPVTDLDLSLKGIIARKDSANSLALIAMGKQPERPYSVGEEIQADVRLEEIGSHRVVLNVKGREELLYLRGVQDPVHTSGGPLTQLKSATGADNTQGANAAP